MPTTPHRTTRREWLTNTAAIGTALAAPHLLGLPAVHAAGDERIRVGLVGCGGRGMGAASQTLSVAGSNVVLTAVADAFEQRALAAPAGLKEMHGDQVDVPVERRFFGFDAHRHLLEHCDLVLLCTPPSFRPFQFQAAVEAGKHVFMEKPICVDAFGARMALAAAAEADRKNLKVVMGLQKRYEPWYQETVQRVRDGAIGEITSAQVYRMAGPMWYKTREAAASELAFQVNNWTHFNWLCPGVQVEGHVHELDIVNWLLDAHPVSASGMGGQQGQPRDLPSQVFDHFSIEYRYPNGVVVNSQSRQMPGCKNDVREEYRGTKGILRAPMGEMRDYSGNLIWRYEPTSKKTPNPYQIEHDVLHAAIRDGQPLNNGHYGATSSFTAVLGMYAALTGEEMRWDESLALSHRTMPENLSWETLPPVVPDADGQYPLPVPGIFKLV